MAKSNKKLSDGLTQTLPDRPLCYFTLSKTILLVKGDPLGGKGLMQGDTRSDPIQNHLTVHLS